MQAPFQFIPRHSPTSPLLDPKLTFTSEGLDLAKAVPGFGVAGEKLEEVFSEPLARLKSLVLAQ